MARDRIIPFVDMVLTGCSGNEQGARTVIEALRIFGFVNEQDYSSMNTALTRIAGIMVRSDGAETIELARDPKVPTDPEEILPKEY